MTGKFFSFLVSAILMPNICFAALTAEFTFNGNTTDSVSGSAGTTYGNVKYGNGFLNNAIYLDGDGDYIDYGKGFNLGKDFTFNVWIKPDRENLQRKLATIFAKYETNGYRPYWFGLYYGQPNYSLSNGTGSHQEHISKTKLIPDTWYMLTYTYSYEKQQLTIYINGEYDNSFSCVPVTQNDDKVTVGRQALMFQPYADLQYKGWIDEMQIYDQKLTADYIKALYKRYSDMSGLTTVPTRENTFTNNPTTKEDTNSARIFHLNPGYKQGNHYEEGGLFITNLNVKENLNDEKPVTFDVYNTKDAMGIVEYYDEKGKFIRADKIEPHNVVIKDFDSFVEIFKRSFLNKIKSTPIKAPKGTRTIIVTNNQTKSVYLLVNNVVDNIFKELNLIKSLNDLLMSYEAFNADIERNKLIRNVKEKITEKIIHTLQINYVNMIVGNDLSENKIKLDIGITLLEKFDEEGLGFKNSALRGFDFQKIFEESMEYVFKNSAEVSAEVGKSIAFNVCRSLLNGNPAIWGIDCIAFVGNSLDNFSKLITEKQLEKAKPMVFYIENVAKPTNVVPDISTNETEMLKKLVGTYKGSYVANQGETGLTLTVYEENNQFKALFDFYNLPGRTNAKSGKYYMNVSYDKISGNYKLDAYQWLEQPSGYDFINLNGKLDKNILSGDSFHLNGPRWRFSVTRVNEVPDISTNETEMLKKLVGTYKGSYVANQGETGLTLTVYEENNQFKALFDFYNLPGRTNAKSGKYYMNVSYDKISGNYKLYAYQWIDRPSGWDFINLNGKLNKNILSGDSFHLNGPRWRFSVTRISDSNAISTVNKNIPSDALSYKGHHYYIYSNVCNTWEEAKKYCENLGGHLAVINDKAENDALYSYITNRGHKTAYFGLSDSTQEGNWKWLDDSVNYYNWFSGEPNGGRFENYAEFYYQFPDGRWNDGNFGHGTQNDSKNFICEWDY